MKLTAWIHYLWKVPLCGLIFFSGFIPGNKLAAWIGLPMPSMPVGADQATVAQFTLLGSLILVFGLAAVARGLVGNFFSRWLTLFFLLWVAYGVNNYLEASIFSTMTAGALYSVVLYLPAALMCSAAVAWLFPANHQAVGFFSLAREFFARQNAMEWTWRLVAAFLAFPLAYYVFGSLISPIVLPYYLSGANQLALPVWGQILPVLFLRSLLFLLVCLPVLIAWRLSNRRLFLTLGLTLFIMVGGVSMLSAYWLPAVLRVTHSLEIFTDEMVYAGALVLVLYRPATKTARQQVSIPA